MAGTKWAIGPWELTLVPCSPSGTSRRHLPSVGVYGEVPETPPPHAGFSRPVPARG